MNAIALVLGFVMAAIGVLGVGAPQSLLAVLRAILTPLGLYVLGGVRIAIGIVFLMAAPSSRAPRFLLVLGVVAVIGGLITPLFGVERAHAILDWWAGRSPGAVRLWAGVAIALGGGIVYAVAPRRAAV